MLLDKAKKAIEAKEAEVKGTKWLSEVKDGSGQWKDLAGWKETYEPKKETKEDSERKKAAKEKAKGKALDVAFEKLQEGLSKELLKLMMEISSLFLGKASEAAKDPFMPKILSSTNAIILSYRFDKSNDSRKFAFIRKEACDELTVILHQLLPEKGPSQISGDLRGLFEEQKTTIRSLIMQKLDIFLATVDGKIDEKAQDVEGKIDKAKEGVDTAAEMAKAVAGQELVEEARVRAEAELVACTGVQIGDGGLLLKEQKGDIIAEFGAVLKGLLQSKMEELDKTLIVYVEEFLVTLDAALKLVGKAVDGKKKTQADLKEEMLAVIEKLYRDAKSNLALEVQKVLDMLKAMVANAHGDGEDEE